MWLFILLNFVLMIGSLIISLLHIRC